MKKNIAKRALSASILLLIILPFFVTTNLFQKEGKIIGFIFYICLSLLALYEILKHTKLNSVSITLLLFLSLVVWFFPSNLFFSSDTNYIFNNTKGLKIDKLREIIYESLFVKDAIINIVCVQFIAIPVIVMLIYSSNIKKYFNFKEMIIEYIIVASMLLYIPIFLKILFLFNITNLYFLAIIFAIPVIVDTSAYFGGMLLGHKFIKRKFSPRISPKKTWEGAIISYILGFICVYLLFYLGHQLKKEQITFFTKIPQLIIGMIIIPMLSIVGDLMFSLIKRIFKIKDYSNLIPGHGGIMDRFDSTSLVAIGVSIILLI